MLTTLRQTLQMLERPVPLADDPGSRAFGIASLDAALGGGLARGALHEIAAVSESHIATASGFALGLTDPGRRVVWIGPEMTALESGAPCGPGLGSFGLAPERLIAVTTANNRDLVWAMEETLRCRAVGAVIGELRHAHPDMVTLRRLSLAAAAHGALALLLRAQPAHDASTAATRWIVSAAPSQSRFGPGAPRMTAQLVRNRRGPLGSWMLEWSSSDERFVLASTHPQSLVAPVADRQACAAVA